MLAPVGELVDQFGRAEPAITFGGQDVVPVLCEELGGGDIDGDPDIRAGSQSGALDSGDHHVQRARLVGSTGPSPPSSAISATE